MTAPNVPNRTIFCDDNLDVMCGINSECIDLIYLDPPFNKNKEFTAPIGSSAEGASFKDIFREEDLKDEWVQTIGEDWPELHHYLNGIRGVGKPYNFPYLAYMAIRLIECRRILKEMGSIYLHCDPTMSHYLKTTMDCIFEEGNFREEISWKRALSEQKGSQFKPRSWGGNTDIILFYVKSDAVRIDPYRKLAEDERVRKFKHVGEDGRRYYLDNAHIWRTPNMGARPNLCYEWRGFKNPHPAGWRLSKERLEEEYQKGNFVIRPDGKLERRKYEENYPGRPIGNFWDDIKPVQGKERTNYPTQKPLALLERIIKASSNEGDLILDAFCGCATTCVAAEKCDRQWIGIDISVEAYKQVEKRMKKEVDKPQTDIFKGDTSINLKTNPPVRTDQNGDRREQKFVYVISHPNFPGEYKVGIAKEWKSRLNSYQTSDPERQYKLEFKIETPKFRETEKYIHDLFPNKHEWVQGDLDEIIGAIQEYIK